jgi:hypothetical protein
MTAGTRLTPSPVRRRSLTAASASLMTMGMPYTAGVPATEWIMEFGPGNR